MHSGWHEAQDWERDWWGDCCNTLGEELKQRVYADRMGLRKAWLPGGRLCYDLQGASVLDLGGGPCSLLLKCVNKGAAAVVDPCAYPAWVAARYDHVGVKYVRMPAEDATESHVGPVDEAWIYNVLQHVSSPSQIVVNARKVAKLVRIFEWIDTPPNVGHPHTLREANLNHWLGGEGRVEQINEGGCVGKCYYGVFKA